MDRQKGLNARQIKEILELDWDDSDAEVEPEISSTQIPADEAIIFDHICEDITAADLQSAEFPEEIKLQDLELEETVNTISEDTGMQTEFQKVDIKNLRWRKITLLNFC